MPLNSTLASAILGLRSKSGRAVLVALGGTLDAPRLLLRRELTLTSPEDAATFQPFHQVMDLPWEDALVAAQITESLIESVATEALGGLLHELRLKGHRAEAVGVVGSPDRDLLRIGSRHIRSHAAEGLLFRRVLEGAAAKHGIPARTFSDRDTGSLACEQLSWSQPHLKEVLHALGHGAGPPWRADERLASLAALMAMRFVAGLIV